MRANFIKTELQNLLNEVELLWTRQHVPLIDKHSCFQRGPNCIFFFFIKCPIYQRQTTLIDSGEDYARQNKNMSNTLLCAVIYSVHTCF
jgi:hypothetical protein